MKHSHCPDLRSQKTKGGPVRAGLLELDLNVQTAYEGQSSADVATETIKFMSEVPPLLPF